MQNKPVALVTGANQGIGRQIAKDLVAHGFTVLAGSHNGDQLSALRLDQSQNAMAITSAMSDRRLAVTTTGR